MILPESLTYTVVVAHRANRSHKSLCSIGLLHVEKGEKVWEKEILVNPHTKSFSFAHYHGISAARVASCPALPEAWEGVKQYFTGQNIVSYSADACDDTLIQSLQAYGIDFPPCQIVHVNELFRADRGSVSLRSLAKSLDFDDDFTGGDTLETLDLLNLAMERAAARGSRVIQKAFGVKSYSEKVLREKRQQEEQAARERRKQEEQAAREKALAERERLAREEAERKAEREREERARKEVKAKEKAAEKARRQEEKARIQAEKAKEKAQRQAEKAAEKVRRQEEKARMQAEQQKQYDEWYARQGKPMRAFMTALPFIPLVLIVCVILYFVL